MTIEARFTKLHDLLRWNQIPQVIGLGIEALNSPLTVPTTILSQENLGKFLAKKCPRFYHSRLGRICFNEQLQIGMQEAATIVPLLIAGTPIVTSIAIYGLKKIQEIFLGNETSFT